MSDFIPMKEQHPLRPNAVPMLTNVLPSVVYEAMLHEQGYRLVLDGPSGRYFAPAGLPNADHALWIGWDFDGTYFIERITEKEDS